MYLFLFVIILLLGPQTLVWGNSTSLNSKETFHVMVVVSTPIASDNNRNHLWPKWERGDEILSGAQTAAEEVNESHGLLGMYQLKILPITVSQCNPIAEVQSFVGKLTSQEPIAIVGYFCDNLIRYFSQVAAHDKLGVIQISAMPTLTTESKDHKLIRFHHILPSPIVMAKAAVRFIQKLAITTIGVVSAGVYHDTHYSKMTEIFLSMVKPSNITVEFLTKEPSNTSMHTLAKLRVSTAKLIVAFLPPSEAVDVICDAYLQGFKWPYYVWLYVEINIDKIMTGSKRCSEHTMTVAIEDVVFLHLESMPDGPISSSDNISSGYNATYLQQLKAPSYLQINPYANALYDSIWAIALALNNSMKHSISLHYKKISIDADRIDKELNKVMFQGATGFVNFSQRGAAVQLSVSVYLAQLREAILIGSYDSSLNRLQLNVTMFDEVVNSERNHLYILYPTYLTVISCTFMALSLVFTTTTLSLFIHYRKTPKVKATSSVLSLCMFVGCYCLIVSSIFHTIDSSFVIRNTVQRYASCWGNTFLFTVAVDLVLATVFAKTLRIYHIFKTFGKISKLWSDKGLFALILAVVSVKVALMIVWGAVDMNHLIDDVISPLQGFPPHYVVVQKCYSRHLMWWVAFVFGYSASLFLPMVTVAVLTRKIKRREFKDSKKICALVAILFIFICIGTSLWFILREVGAYIASKLVYGIGFPMVAIICQVFLFVPKIIPPVVIINLTAIKKRLQATFRSYKRYSYRRISLT